MRTALIKTCNYGYTKHVEWPDGKQVFTNYKGGNEMGRGGHFSAKLNSGDIFLQIIEIHSFHKWVGLSTSKNLKGHKTKALHFAT